MEVVFRCLSEGKKLHAVRRQGEEIFVGTEEECMRFLDLHNRKVAEEQECDLRTPRRGPYAARTYRTSRSLQA